MQISNYAVFGRRAYGYDMKIGEFGFVLKTCSGTSKSDCKFTDNSAIHSCIKCAV